MVAWLLSVALAQSVSGPTGQVTEAVVYPDRARVTREVSVELTAGDNDVVFADLPPNLDVLTLQADGTGNAVIRGLSVDRTELAEDRRDRVGGLEAQIRDKQDTLRALADDVTAAQAELTFLRSLGAAGAGQLSAELLFAPDTTSDADALAALLRRRVGDALDSVRVAEAQQAVVQRELEALQRELSTVQGASQWARHKVTVQLSSPASGPATVSITYTVPGASWTPRWDARAELDDPTLQMTLSANVVQTTGEDWSGVALSLSTARPAAGVDAPSLDPFWLTAPVVYRASRGSKSNSMMMESVAMSDDEGGGEDMAYAPDPMLVQQAQVVEQAVASSFEVPSGTNIGGDGTSRTVQVTTVAVPATWMHVAVPLQDERAWVVAEGTWPASWSLLAGDVSVFEADSYVGSMRLPIVGSGSTFELGFGPDETVRVERTLIEDMRRAPGFLRRPRLERRWRTVVTNGYPSERAVSVRDRIPVSTESRWDVDPLGDEPTELLDEGLRRWERTLAPGAEWAVETGWRVTWPKKYVPGGL